MGKARSGRLAGPGREGLAGHGRRAGLYPKDDVQSLDILKSEWHGNSLAVQWLGLCASTAGGPSSIPGRGTKIPQALPCGQKNK